MLNTMRLKILAAAVALLAVFAVTTGFSTWLVKNVVEEMDAITAYHIPIGAHVAGMDLLTFELEVELRRAMAQVPLEAPRLAVLRKRYAEITATLKSDVKQVHGRLADAIADRRNDVDDRIVLAGLKGSFAFIEARLGPFLRTSDTVLAAIESGDPRRAAGAMAAFGQFESVFGEELVNVRRTLEGLTLSSVTETRQHQRAIYRLNGLLFALAIIVGLGLFLAPARRSQRSRADLLAGTREVEAGRLDAGVAVTSGDETKASTSPAARKPSWKKWAAGSRRTASRRARSIW
jgi:adenylate cyclase